MKNRLPIPIALSIALISLTGCVSAVKTVVTAPFKVAGKAVDWTTTSQDESDRNRGRADRKAEKRDEKAQKREQKERIAREKQQIRDDS